MLVIRPEPEWWHAGTLSSGSRDQKHTTEGLRLRCRKPEADVVGNPYSVRIDKLGF